MWVKFDSDTERNGTRTGETRRLLLAATARRRHFQNMANYRLKLAARETRERDERKRDERTEAGESWREFEFLTHDLF